VKVRATEIDVLRSLDSAERYGSVVPAVAAWGAMKQMPLAGSTPAPQTLGGFVGRVRRLVGKGLVEERVTHGFVLTDGGRAALAAYHGEAVAR